MPEGMRRQYGVHIWIIAGDDSTIRDYWDFGRSPLTKQEAREQVTAARRQAGRDDAAALISYVHGPAQITS